MSWDEFQYNLKLGWIDPIKNWFTSPGDQTQVILDPVNESGLDFTAGIIGGGVDAVVDGAKVVVEGVVDAGKKVLSPLTPFIIIAGVVFLLYVYIVSRRR